MARHLPKLNGSLTGTKLTSLRKDSATPLSMLNDKLIPQKLS
ncbi:hypothetical protein ANCCAN_00075 [Ancylostoma caninum]|uniref:Uncharacterized protein n=1 Tax=Ancylostoma caninum TaxID=29170 RepID=A0A368HAE8_ANCCA|nr:hypothetical protein ANCCAN_00075 [Ancylostoma caninum]